MSAPKGPSRLFRLGSYFMILLWLRVLCLPLGIALLAGIQEFQDLAQSPDLTSESMKLIQKLTLERNELRLKLEAFEKAKLKAINWVRFGLKYHCTEKGDEEGDEGRPYILGCSDGGGIPGEFFIYSKVLIELGSKEDFINYLKDESILVRTVGRLGLAQKCGVDAIALIQSNIDEHARVEFQPFGCEIMGLSETELVTEILHNCFVLNIGQRPRALIDYPDREEIEGIWDESFGKQIAKLRRKAATGK